MTCSAHSMPSVPPTTAALPELGVAAVEIGLAAELAGFVAAEAAGQLARYPGFHEWTAPDFRVEAGGPIEAGVDGEALVLESPLGVPFSPRRATGPHPDTRARLVPGRAHPTIGLWTVRALNRVLAGRPPALGDHLTADEASPSRTRR